MVTPDETELCQHCKVNPVVVRTTEEKDGIKRSHVLCAPCAMMLGIGFKGPHGQDYGHEAIQAAYFEPGDILTVLFKPRPEKVTSTQFQDWLWELRDVESGELVMVQINGFKAVLEEAKKLFKQKETGGAEWV